MRPSRRHLTATFAQGILFIAGERLGYIIDHIHEAAGTS